ncbi:ATP-binding protein [Streptomyces sp. ATMOS53]
MPTTETFSIPKRREHVPAARHSVRKTLGNWGISGGLADDVTLSANELVTNAVTHCRVTYSQVRATLTLQGPYLFLEVYDPDRDRLPEVRERGPDAEGGRGLTLVGQLTHGWGHTQRRHTKCVWARFLLPEGRMFRWIRKALAGPEVDDLDPAREVPAPDPYVWPLPDPREARWRRWARRSRAAGRRLPFPREEECWRMPVPRMSHWEAGDEVVRLYVLRP